jgi:integrase
MRCSKPVQKIARRLVDAQEIFQAPATTNADLKAIKMICRAAKRDGYIAEDPAEFIGTVRKGTEQARRPFTISEIQRVLSVADAEWKSLILFGLYTGQRLADIATLDAWKFTSVWRWVELWLFEPTRRLRLRPRGK